MSRPKQNYSILWKILFSIIIFCSGLFIGTTAIQKNSTFSNVREDSNKYNFIAPLLFTKIPEDFSYPEYNGLKDTLDKYAKDALKNKLVTDISIYYRNLNTSQWVSVNPDGTFSPSSMLKVVTLISVLRKVDENPAILDQKLTLTGPDETLVEMQSRYAAANPVRSGGTYTVRQLLEHMIKESDNVANTALNNFVGTEEIEKTYTDLELPKPNLDIEQNYTITEYSHLYRTLFNGTYLSKQNSEYALDLLSKTDFKSGIVAGVPDNIVTSHKFGVHTVTEDDSTTIAYRELHDCGIVYYPNNPYFICVMTRGSDFSTLEKVIKGASQSVWNFIDNKYSQVK